MLATRRPAKIYITGRNHAAAQQTINDLKSIGATETELEWIQCDHANLASMKEAADQVLAKESRLDVLMANAGIMALPPGLVSDSPLVLLSRSRDKRNFHVSIILQDLEPRMHEPFHLLRCKVLLVVSRFRCFQVLGLKTLPA